MIMTITVPLDQLANMKVAFGDCGLEPRVLEILEGAVCYIVPQVEIDRVQDIANLATCAEFDWTDDLVVRKTYGEYFGKKVMSDSDKIMPSDIQLPE